MRRLSLTFGLAVMVSALGAGESYAAFFARGFVTAQATTQPTASPAPGVTAAPKRRGIFGRRQSATPLPSASPSPVPTPTQTPLPPPTPPPPTAPPTRVPAPTPKPTSPDRAFALAGGTWNCESLAEGTGTHVYELTSEYSLAMTNRINVDGHAYIIEETYRFDPATERWTTTTGKNAYLGSAEPWTGERWVFDGTETIMGERHPVRMVYIDLGGEAFRRDFQSEQNRRWTTFSAETCKRAQR